MFTLLTFFQNSPAKTQVKGVFISSRFKNHAQTIKKLKEWGVNTVILSKSLLTKELANKFRKEGIKVYAELTVFQGDYLWREYPQSRPVQADGKPLNKIKWYAGICPNQNWLREKKLNEIKEITGLPVDGVFLDFIRYPCYWEVPEPRLDQTCFCPVCLKKFADYTSLSYPRHTASVRSKARWILEKHKKKWTDFKCRVIAEFLKECKVILSKKNMLLGFFGVPWREEEKGGAIKNIVGQDYGLLSLYADIISPMAYHRLCQKAPEWVGEISSTIKGITKKEIWPIVEVENIPFDEFQQVLNETKKGDGVIIFTLNKIQNTPNEKVFKEYTYQ